MTSAAQKSTAVSRSDRVFLRMAAQRGELARLQELLGKGVPVDTLLDHGATPLLLAAQCGHGDVVAELLKRDANVLFRRESDGVTPLITAINSGHAAAVGLLLDRRVVQPSCKNSPLQVALFFVTADETANVLAEVLDLWSTNEKDQTQVMNITPLRIAFSEAHLDVVSVLLDRLDAVHWAEFSLEVALYVACQAGNVDVVKKLLVDRKVNPNFRSEDGVTPLANAFIHAKSEVVALLLDARPVPSAKDTKLEIELFFSTENGVANIVAGLADLGLRRKDDGTSPLLMQLSETHLDVLSVLLDREDKVTWRELSLEVALFAASNFGHVGLVSKLLRRNARIHFSSEDGVTPLFVACLNGHDEVVSALLKKGAEVGWPKSSLVLPLRLAAEKGRTEDVALLIRHGADVNTASEHDGVTPLVAALKSEHHDVIDLLLEKSAVVDWEHPSSDIAASVAAENGHVRVLEEFLGHGGEANFRDKNEVSLLQLACSSGQLAAVRVLLARGALVDLPDLSGGITPLMIASQEGDVDIVAALVEHGASADLTEESQGITALLMASQNGHAEVVKRLLKHGADVKLRRSDGVGPLVLAASNGHVAALKVLLEARTTRARASDDDDSPENALLYAAQAGHAAVVHALITHGVDLDFTSKGGVTPLAAAAQSGHTAIVGTLLDQKAGSSEYSRGMALLVAAQNGHVDVVVELLDRGVPVSFSNRDGVTALQIAETSGFADLASMLRDWEPMEP
ncbi:hypothetical protein Gpo141_00005492 [Globisporangium polare]